MKTVLLFHRCNLTYHFAWMSKFLAPEFNIIHLAYSQHEYDILVRMGITNVTVLKEEIEEICKGQEYDLCLLNKIDEIFYTNTGGRFNLNSSINCDRGFTLLGYDTCLMLAQAYYTFWDRFLDDNEINYVFHEAPSLFFNHMCAVLCRSKTIKYIYQAWGESDEKGFYFFHLENDTYSCPQMEYLYSWYKKYPEKIDESRCRKYIENFRKNSEILFTGQVSPKASLYKLGLRALREKIRILKNRKRFDKIYDNIEYWTMNNRAHYHRYKNIRDYNRHISFCNVIAGEKYYYYPFHLEPEATIFYLSAGFYSNQVKLIENIASQLPADTYLYVKDHPHEYGYRSVEDYKRLQNIPNVRLLHQDIPGKKVIRDSLGVFTINGTAGYEAILLGKTVICFGPSYYSFFEGVTYIENVKDIRKYFYESGMNKKAGPDVRGLYAYVNAYLDSLYPGMVDFFSEVGKYPLDYEQNAKCIAEAFSSYLKFED